MRPVTLPDVVALGAALHARGAGDSVATFDGEGRLLSFRLDGVHHRRGLDGSIVRLVCGGPGAGQPWRARRVDDPGALLDALAAALGDVGARATDDRARRMAARAVAGMAEHWASDVARFREVLGCVPIVPPMHVRSVVLRLTEGCGYARCRFCTLYERIPFRVRSDAEWREHVRDVLDWFGEGAGVRPSLWIGDASVLEAGEERLVDALDALREQVNVLPADAPSGALHEHPRSFEGVYAFADVPRGAHLGADAATALAARGVRRLYLGLESGHRPLLRLLRKPHAGSQVIDALGRLHEGGVSAGVVVLVGAGGEDLVDAHHRDTVALVSRLGLSDGDLVLISPLDEHARAGAAAGERPLADAALAAATARLSADLEAVVRRGVRVTDYGLEGFVY